MMAKKIALHRERIDEERACFEETSIDSISIDLEFVNPRVCYEYLICEE